MKMGFLDDIPGAEGGRTKAAKKPSYGIGAAVEPGVVYWKPVKCPACGSKNCPVYSTLPPDANTQIRYHKCGVCGLNFKSIEEK